MLLGVDTGGPPMPAFIDAGAGTAGSGGGTISPAYPAAIVAGQFLVLHLFLGDSGTPTAATPAGWTLADALPAGSSYKQWLFWKVATGSESGTQAVTVSANIAQAARIYRFTSGSGIDAQGAIGGHLAASSTDLLAESLNTTLGPNRRALQLLAATVNTTISDITGELFGIDFTEAVAEFTTAQPVLIDLQTAPVATAQIVVGNGDAFKATLGVAGTHRCSYGAAIAP